MFSPASSYMVDVPAGVGVALPIANSSRLGKPGTMPYDFSRKPVGLRSFASKVMRVPDDLRRCVVFIGRVDGPSGEGFKAVGTALLVRYERFGYLVTVQHIAAGFGDGPFAVRL